MARSTAVAATAAAATVIAEREPYEVNQAILEGERCRGDAGACHAWVRAALAELGPARRA